MSRSWGAARIALAGIGLVVCATGVVIGSAASAATQRLVGVDEVRFAWAPATGATDGYLVSIQRNDGPLTASSLVTLPSVTVPVSPGDRIAIAVRAVGRKSDGSVAVGPFSALSDLVYVLRSPSFPVVGTWTLACAACPSVAVRSLGDASVILAEAPGPPPPWRIAGRAAVASGREMIVWQNPVTGVIVLWDPEDLRPIPGGYGFGPVGGIVIGGADFDGDGVEELVLHRPDVNQVEFFALTGSGLARVAVLPGSAGARLAAVEDLTGDGTVELVWQNFTLGTLQYWSVLADPRRRVSLSSHLLVSGALVKNALLVDTGDYDGDGERDLLWRYPDGELVITYLDNGLVARFANLPELEGDATRMVVGSVDINGAAGDEIAIQDFYSKAISILLPTYLTAPARINVLNPGVRWLVVDVGG